MRASFRTLLALEHAERAQSGIAEDDNQLRASAAQRVRDGILSPFSAKMIGAEALRSRGDLLTLRARARVAEAELVALLGGPSDDDLTLASVADDDERAALPESARLSGPRC